MTTPPSGGRGPVVILSESDCLTLLETTTVGNFAFVDDEGQQLVPVNFVVLDKDIYFRTLPDGFLSVVAKGHQDVAFGITHHDIYGIGWNVTARGSTHEVVDPELAARVLSHPRLNPWAAGERSLVIQVKPTSIAGRRVARRWATLTG